MTERKLTHTGVPVLPASTPATADVKELADRLAATGRPAVAAAYTDNRPASCPKLELVTGDINPGGIYLTKEVATRLRISVKQVYALFDRGVLIGPADKPRRVYTYSLIDYLSNTNAAPARPEPEPEIMEQLTRPARKTPTKGSRVALPHPGRSR